MLETTSHGNRDRVGDLDASATLAGAESVVRRRRAVELEDLLLLSHWATLHGDDPGASHHAGDRLVQLGGEGTPMVRELCIAEIAIARQVHPESCGRAMADVLDLQHRLPRTWERVTGLETEAWLARRVASLTRHLGSASVGLVDAAVAKAIAGQAPSRVLAIAEAKIIEADPGKYAAEVEAQRRRRHVSLGRTDEFGLRHVIARVTAGDAAWIDAMVERVADILSERAAEDHGRDELRAEAFGWLARPGELLQLLLEHHEGADPCPSRATALPADLLDSLKTVDPVRLRPRGVLYVHLHQQTLSGAATGVARVEGIGPMLPAEALELLAATTRVSVRPVIDLADRVSVNAYEQPSALKERVHLMATGDYFPYAASTSRAVDYDHPEPFDPSGPPGQTGSHNSGPLTRRHHRIKTHAGYRSRQLAGGRYVWRTPHGRYLLVDHTGTQPVPPAHGEMLLAAPDGLELFFADLVLGA